MKNGRWWSTKVGEAYLGRVMLWPLEETRVPHTTDEEPPLHHTTRTNTSYT